MTRRKPGVARLLMTAVFAANGLAFGTWAGNIPRLREAAGLSDAQLGLLLLAVSLGAVLAMPLAGGWSERIGTDRMCALAGAGLAAAGALPALSAGAGAWALGASAVLFGSVFGALDVAMNARAAVFERAWGAPVMSSMHAGWSGGQLTGAALAGLFGGLHAPLPVAAALPGVAVVTLAACALRVPVPPTPAAEKAPRFALPNRAMLGICALTGLSFAIEGAVADWSGVYLSTDLGARPELASTSLGAFATVMVLCRLVGDGVVRRFGRTAVVRGGSLVAAAGLAGAVASPNIATASACFAVVGLGVANTVPVLFSAAGSRGAAGVAMAATVGYGAVMGAPVVMGFVADTVSLRAALLLAACAGLCIAWLAAAARPGERR